MQDIPTTLAIYYKYELLWYTYIKQTTPTLENYNEIFGRYGEES